MGDYRWQSILPPAGTRSSLGSTGAPVAAGERGELRSLLAAMDLPEGPLAGLNVEG